MLFDKTDQARAALARGAAAGLSLQERRILILIDGKRSLDEVVAMLGTDILPTLDRLLREGYIARRDQGGSAARGASLGGALTGLIRAATDVVQARAEQIRTNGPAPSPAAPEPHVPLPATTAPAATRQAGSRRSLAACKMYLLDMLQLQRDPESVSLRAELQTSPSEDELVLRMMKALRHLQAVASPSYAQRIAERLAEILPEPHLPHLEAARVERPEKGGPPSLSVVA
jgi:hypothetical protein